MYRSGVGYQSSRETVRAKTIDILFSFYVSSSKDYHHLEREIGCRRSEDRWYKRSGGSGGGH